MKLQEFCRSVLFSLGFGKSVGEAFGQAKVALMLENIPEKTPRSCMYHKGLTKAKSYWFSRHEPNSRLHKDVKLSASLRVCRL